MTSHSLESPRFTSFKQHVGTLSDPCSLHYRRRRPGRASPPAPLLCPPFLPPSPCSLSSLPGVRAASLPSFDPFSYFVSLSLPLQSSLPFPLSVLPAVSALGFSVLFLSSFCFLPGSSPSSGLRRQVSCPDSPLPSCMTLS